MNVADAIQDALTEQRGVDFERLIHEGYGRQMWDMSLVEYRKVVMRFYSEPPILFHLNHRH